MDLVTKLLLVNNQICHSSAYSKIDIHKKRLFRSVFTEIRKPFFSAEDD